MFFVPLIIMSILYPINPTMITIMITVIVLPVFFQLSGPGIYNFLSVSGLGGPSNKLFGAYIFEAASRNEPFTTGA